MDPARVGPRASASPEVRRLITLDTSAIVALFDRADAAQLERWPQPLGFADAAVIACAERNGGRVLSLDRRHFDMVGRELGLEILP